MKYQYKYNKTLVPFAQTNKKLLTDAERLLWFHLRNRQINGHKFRRQYPIQNFILDFYCVEKKLAIELDGSQHRENGRYDNSRAEVLKKLEIRTIRFWDNNVLQNTKGVLEKIYLELEGVDNSTSS